MDERPKEHHPQKAVEHLGKRLQTRDQYLQMLAGAEYVSFICKTIWIMLLITVTVKFQMKNCNKQLC